MIDCIPKKLGTKEQAREWLMSKAVPQENGCWLVSEPYQSFSIGGKSWRANRLSYVIEHGEIDRSLFVCHRCDNPRCVNLDHLFLGTAKDNVADMVRKNRNKRTHSPYGRLLRPQQGRTEAEKGNAL